MHTKSCAANICGNGGSILCSAAANYVDAALSTCADSDGTLPSAQVAVTENSNLTIMITPTQPYATWKRRMRLCRLVVISSRDISLRVSQQPKSVATNGDFQVLLLTLQSTTL